MKPFANPVTCIIGVRTVQASLIALALHGLLHWPLTGPHALGLFFTPLLCLYFVFVFVAPWNWGLPILTRLPTRERVVALTFDDGPSPDTTPRILDILAQCQMPATFFVLGEQARRHPELLRRIVAEGHGLGIHGDTHTPFVLLPWRRVGEEIERTRAAVQQAIPDAEPLCWLRPPYGFKTLALPRLARRQGCRLAAWNLDTRDYRCPDPAKITQQALSCLRPGAILLLHDRANNKATADALPAILAGLAQQGYRAAVLPRCAASERW
jgi:peptidoglycan/xylan/chitin deacetylase (PgdA/CDA1 family)